MTARSPSTAFVARAAGPDGRRRVLLAEEDAITVDVIRHRLERDGLAVETVGDGPAALDALAARSFDAVLLGAVLAGVDGVEILRRIRAGDVGRPQTGVGLIVWPGNDGLVARAYNLDADDVIVRPLSLVAVSASVRRLARRAFS